MSFFIKNQDKIAQKIYFYKLIELPSFNNVLELNILGIFYNRQEESVMDQLSES